MAYLLHATSTRSRAISGKAATHSWRADLLREKSSTSSSAVASVVLEKRISGQNRTSGAELQRLWKVSKENPVCTLLGSGLLDLFRKGEKCLGGCAIYCQRRCHVLLKRGGRSYLLSLSTSMAASPK